MCQRGTRRRGSNGVLVQGTEGMLTNLSVSFQSPDRSRARQEVRPSTKNTSKGEEVLLYPKRWIRRKTRTGENERERDAHKNKSKDGCRRRKPPGKTNALQVCVGHPAHPQRTWAECGENDAASKLNRQLRKAVHGGRSTAVATPYMKCYTRHTAPCADRADAKPQPIVFQRESTTRKQGPTRTRPRTLPTNSTMQSCVSSLLRSNVKRHMN